MSRIVITTGTVFTGIVLAAPVFAEIHIQGTPASLRITTNRDSASDVVMALSTRFAVHYRSAIPIEGEAQPTYTGSLERVVSRLLDGYSYVIKVEKGTTEVVVWGRRGEVAIPPPAAKEPPANSIVAKWKGK